MAKKQPPFKTETQEAEWWAKNQNLIADPFEQAKTAGKLGKGNSSGGRGSDTPKKVVDTGRNIWQSECLETVDSPASSFARQTASSAGQRGIAPGERTSAPRSGAVAAATLRANSGGRRPTEAGRG